MGAQGLDPASGQVATQDRESRLVWKPPDGISSEALAALIGPGAPFEFTEEPVLGTTMPVFVRRARSLIELLTSAAERFPERPYLVFPARSYTFAEILEPVAAAARVLSEDYGVGKGDRVAIASANCPEYAIAFWAATALGAVTVALNGWWTGRELAYAIELTGPRVVLADERRSERIAGSSAAGAAPVVALESDWWRARDDRGDPALLGQVAIAEDDPYLILFTSGTTGRPKGALLSHRGNIHFIQASMLSGALGRAASGEPPDTTPPCVICASPMFHIAGMNSQLVMAPATGLTIVYPPPGRWDETVHLQLSQQHRVTNWSLVPTQLWRLIDHPDLATYDLSALRNIGGGSSVWPPELLRLTRERLPAARAEVRLGYGMTETNGIGTSTGPPFTRTHPGSIGRPYPTVEVEVRDPATDTPVPVGEVGEICLRTAAVMLRYWDNEAATKAALDDNRWYRTGDFGYLRDGFLYLEGRRHDLIIRGGENIYPAEIENRLLEHPEVAEAAVIGVDHPRLGQEVKAVVVPARGCSPRPDDLREWVGEALAAFKVPASVEFRDSLPRNAMGKVLRQVLAQPAGPAAGGSGHFVQE